MSNSSELVERQQPSLDTASDIDPKAVKEITRRTQRSTRRRVFALSQDQELSLAHDWEAFS